MKSRLNRVFAGIALGLLVPVIVSYFYYRFNFNNFGFIKFLDYAVTLQVYTHLITLCALPNLLVFFAGIWLDYLKNARGVLIATFVYAFLVLGLKVFPV